MSQINPNLNNILHKKQINPSFKSDNLAYNQPVQPEMYYEDGVEQQEYYYPESYYTDNNQYPNYYPEEQSAQNLIYPTGYQDVYNLSHDKNGKAILPEFYENADKKEPKSIIDVLKNEPTKMISTWFTNPLLMLGTCGALSYGVDAFNKGCSGEYEKSLLGKATRWGDKIEQSKFAQSKPVQGTVKAIKNGWDKMWGFFNKSHLVRSMTETPSLAEWDSAKYDILPQEVRILEDFNMISEKLELATDNPIKFKDLGITREERKMLKTLYNVDSISKIPQEASINTVLLKRLGKTDAEALSIVNSGNATSLTKSEILKTLGFNTEDIKNIKLEPDKHIEKVKEACKKAGGKVKIGRGHHEILGSFQPLASEVSCDQIANKLKSLHIGDGAKTATGRFMSQLVQKIHRGFTFGGGKLAIFFFIAPWLVMAMKNTKKADPDQKVGTAAYGLVESISWVFTFPLAIKTIYALGGMKYAGMSKDDVTKYRDLITKFNATDFADEAAYKLAKKDLKKQLKLLKNQNNNQLSLFSKIMKKIQSGLQLDLEMFKPFQDGNKFKDFMRRLPNNARNWVGVPLRVIITGFVIESAYRNILMKGVKAIFGKNYDEIKEEEHDEAKKAQKEFTIQDLRRRMTELQEAKLNGTTIPENNDFAIPEDLQKTLAYEMHREALEEQKKEIENHSKINEEQPIEAQEAIASEENIEQNEGEELPPSSSMIDDYVQNKQGVSENQNEQTIAEHQNLNSVEEKPIENIDKASYSPVSQTETEQYTTNPMTSDLISAATAGAVVGAQNHQVEEKPRDNYSYMPSQSPSKEVLEQKKETKKLDNYTYIPSEKNIIKDESKDEKVNKYIPSQRAAKITKSFDNSGLDEALARADRAEQRALKILAGNFDGMV